MYLCLESAGRCCPAAVLCCYTAAVVVVAAAAVRHRVPDGQICRKFVAGSLIRGKSQHGAALLTR